MGARPTSDPLLPRTGVRKQSCLRRRCSRSSDSKGAAEPEEQAEGSAEAAGGREDAGFWLAVEGCMALLNGSVGRTSPTSSSDSPVPAGFVCAHARPHAAACAAIDLAAAAAVDPASACASLAAVAADAERIAAGDAASDVSDEMVGVAPHQGDDDADTETQPTPTLAPSRDPHVSPVMLAGSALLECSLGGFETPPRAECSQPQRGSSSSPVLASLPTNMPVLAGGKK